MKDDMVKAVSGQQTAKTWIPTVEEETSGGSVTAGLVICDVLNACAGKMEIDMFCIGMAASMGAYVRCRYGWLERSGFPLLFLWRVFAHNLNTAADISYIMKL